MEKIKRKLVVLVSVILLVAIVVGVFFYTRKTDVPIIGGVKDSWKYNPEKIESDRSFFTSSFSQTLGVDSAYSPKGATSSAMGSGSNASFMAESATDSYLGFSVGGANNIENYRENIKNGYFPLSTDITYNGIYSEYYFDTGIDNKNRNTEDLFYPSYQTAISTDPISGKQEKYISVGLNSNIKESDFKRPKVNLVVVLDISGSMSSGFNNYYYDGNKKDYENKSKMEIANETINNLIDKLNPDDRLGIVLFDDSAYLGKEIEEISETNVEKLKEHILEIKSRGGTNFEAGYKRGTKLFKGLKDDLEYENRIVVLTDAMPNIGTTTDEGLGKMIKNNADDEIYTSFIGIGVDFNTQLIEGLSDVRGANYYSVHNSEEFNKVLADEFDFMITPLVFDLNLKLESDKYEIENVYGSDSVDKKTGEIMHVNTLFPSSSNSDGEVKGGIIVLKLKEKNNKEDKKDDIKLEVSYKNTDQKEFKNNQEVKFKKSEKDYYESTGIRKAIVLARYVNTVKDWSMYERVEKEKYRRQFFIDETTGIKEFDCEPDYIVEVLGQQERQSVRLTVSDEYKKIFEKVKDYIEEENKELKDDDMKNETEILEKLINCKDKSIITDEDDDDDWLLDY